MTDRTIEESSLLSHKLSGYWSKLTLDLALGKSE